MLKTSWAVIRRFINGSIGPAYYVASNGSDSNDGLSPDTPIQTLSKVNTLDLSTIKTVRFRKGDIFEGTITLQSSGDSSKSVTYTSYGTGDKPKIIGSSLITGWSLHSGNIWKATYATDINQLFVNNVRMQAARWPETGFANVDAAPTTSSLTCNALNGALDYTGVKCIIHSSSYGLETKNVSSSSGTTLTLSAAPFGDVSINEKFILVGKLEFLTKPGQWYYDSATDTVYLWKLDSTQPSDVEVRGSTIDYGFVGTSKSYFVISDLEFAHQKTTGVTLTSCANFTVSNNTFSYPDFKGSSDLSCDFGTYYMNTVVGANSGGMSSDLSDDMTYDSNTVLNIAIFDNLGLGGVGPWYGGSGIATHGDRTLLLRNVLDTIGYNGISFHGLGTVMYNYVTNYCLTKNDGGGIYTSAPVTDGDYAYGDEQNKGSIIRYNTCLYGWGVPEIGTAYGEGIYLDESSGGVTVDYNTVGYCSGRGIFCHKGNSHTVAYNTIYKCENGLYISLVGDAIAMNNNIVYGVANQELVHLNTLSGTPVINNNTYINHYMSNPFQLNWGTRYTFTDWKTTTSHDAASTFDNSAMTANHTDNLLINYTPDSKRYYLNNATSVTNDVTSSSITNYVDLAGYTSMIIKGLNVDCVLDYEDSTAPVITTFDMAANSSSTTVSPLTIEATGGPTKYILTEVNTTPSLTDEGWSETPSYTFASEGTKTLYLWARDAAGNISASVSDTITIEESVFDDVIAWYEFEDSGITLYDSTANNLDAANKTSADADRNVTPVSGMPGNAYPYISTGLQKSIVPDNTLLDFSGVFTIGAWVNVTSLSGFRVICSKQNEFILLVSTTGAVMFRAYENGTTNYVDATSPIGSIVTGNNYLIEVKADGTNSRTGYKIYINNVEQTMSYGGNIGDLTVGIVHGTNSFMIGYSVNMTATMYGNLSQLSLWNKVTSSNVSNKYWNNGDGVTYPVD